MTERLSPSGTVRPVPRAAEPIARFSCHGFSPDSSHHTPLPDVPQALLARPTTEHPREAILPLPQERAARRFHAWRTEPDRRPAFAIPSPTPIAAALACPDLFLLDTPLGQERLQAIVDLIEGARTGGQRLAIVTSNPANANAIVLALPADGIGRARAASETELPPVVAQQTATAMAQREWDARRTGWMAQRQLAAKQLNWWKDWDRLAELEPSVPTDAAAPEHADVETRKTLEAQLAQARPPAGGLSGLVKKLFGGAKVDPQIATLEAKLRELGAAAEIRSREIADDVTRKLAIHAGQLAQFQLRRDALTATRPRSDRDQLHTILADLDAKLAEADRIPTVPPREMIHGLAGVVGPLAALDCDPLFAPTHPEAEPDFDRVVFADAEDLGEAEFFRAARLANAWTLLGSTDIPRPAYRNGKAGRGEFFRDTFDAVCTTPWRRDNDRLIASIADGDSSGLRSEPLADNPAVQLRFRDRPDGETELVEVAFPPSFTLIDAKRFLLDELGAPKAQFLGQPEWTATADAVFCNWPGEGISFDLGAGIRESLLDGFTTGFEFALAAGWTRESAEAWYAEHFGQTVGTRAMRVEMGR